MGPKEWIRLAKILDAKRDIYDAFMIVHGTDTMAYTASALSMMLLVRPPLLFSPPFPPPSGLMDIFCGFHRHCDS